jgi:hypothetical protein
MSHYISCVISKEKLDYESKITVPFGSPNSGRGREKPCCTPLIYPYKGVLHVCTFPNVLGGLRGQLAAHYRRMQLRASPDGNERFER